jgi:hypothetical protein
LKNDASFNLYSYCFLRLSLSASQSSPHLVDSVFMDMDPPCITYVCTKSEVRTTTHSSTQERERRECRVLDPACDAVSNPESGCVYWQGGCDILLSSVRVVCLGSSSPPLADTHARSLSPDSAWDVCGDGWHCAMFPVRACDGERGCRLLAPVSSSYLLSAMH